MKLIDISMKIFPNMMVYKNREEKKPIFKPIKTYENADFYESRLDFDLHTGTHVDAPLHMIEGGKTMEQMDLEGWHGEALVLDLTHVEGGISKSDLEDFTISENQIVLLKTKNSLTELFDPEFVYLDASGAAYLANCKIKGVGIDALGIERAQPDHETHRILFEANCFILEGIRLKEVVEGTYYLMALPLALEGVEASPVRAVLVDFDHS